jgi:hypothetical protein
MLKCVYTWRPVLEKMLGGADLMLPGIAAEEASSMKEVKKGQICAVGLVEDRYIFQWHVQSPYSCMRVSTSHNFLGCEEPLSLDVEQSPNAHACCPWIT